MNISDFQEHVGTLVQKYPKFEFKLEIKGGKFSSIPNDEKERIEMTFLEKGQGSLQINFDCFKPVADDKDPDEIFEKIIGDITSKTSHLGSKNLTHLQIDAGPYVWCEISFIAEGESATSEFDLQRLDEFVELVDSVLEDYR